MTKHSKPSPRERQPAKHFSHDVPRNSWLRGAVGGESHPNYIAGYKPGERGLKRKIRDAGTRGK
jgi:hypothetical protein